MEKFIKGKGRNIKIYKNNDILFDEIDDEIIGYNETNDIIIVFNKSTTIFWSLLDKHDNYKEILDDFKSSFEKESLPEDDLIAEELEKIT